MYVCACVHVLHERWDCRLEIASSLFILACDSIIVTVRHNIHCAILQLATLNYLSSVTLANATHSSMHLNYMQYNTFAFVIAPSLFFS